jgi:hypothetical protein
VSRTFISCLSVSLGDAMLRRLAEVATQAADAMENAEAVA